MKHFITGIVCLLIGSYGTFIYTSHMHTKERAQQEERMDQLVNEKNQNGNKALEYKKLYEEEKNKATELSEALANDPNNQKYQQYHEVVSQAFQTLFNYTPENFKERREKVKAYFSDKLFQSFFNPDGNYTNSNGVSSRINTLSIYDRAVQEKTLDGVVVVDYESKREEGEWIKSTVYYQLSYDVSQKKITDFQTLGTILKGDQVE